MPFRPLRPCAWVRCTELTRTRYCEAHVRMAQVRREQEFKARLERTHRAFDQQRPSARQRGYDSQWEELRAKVLKRSPYCRCGKRATHVDHVLPRARGGGESSANLEACCHSCHSRKTAKYDSNFVRARGYPTSRDHEVVTKLLSDEGIGKDELEQWVEESKRRR